MSTEPIGSVGMDVGMSYYPSVWYCALSISRRNTSSNCIVCCRRELEPVIWLYGVSFNEWQGNGCCMMLRRF